MPDGDSSQNTPPGHSTPIPGFRPGAEVPDEVHAGDTIIERTPPSSITPGTRTPSSSGSRGGSLRPKTEAELAPPDARQAMLDPTKRVNQYVLIQQVGQGGMGSVWKAWDTKLARYVAVKFLNTTDDESIRRFQREAQLAAGLRHPNIATIYEVNELRGVHFLVMDFIDGTSSGKAGLPIQKVVEAFAKVCRAIDYAHKNKIIHRDLKPQNIMVNKEGEPFVTDFGLAKVLSAESSISIAGAILGTPAYMPPEQATGKIQSLDAQSDIYSLGATLYMLVVGRAPFEADNATALLYKVCSSEPEPPRKLNPKVPDPVQAIILKAMEKDKRRRYLTASDMADDLTRYLNNQPILAKPPGLFRKLTRNLASIVKVLLVLLLLGSGAAGGVVLFPKIKAWWLQRTKGDPGWAERYEKLQARLKFEGFQPLSEEDVREAQETFTSMPKDRAEEVAQWLEKQAEDNLPKEVWPRPLWPGKKEEAVRIRNWCGAVLTALQGMTVASAGRFKSLQERLEKASDGFKPVAEFEESDTVRKWKREFDGVMLQLVFASYRLRKPEEIAGLNKIMRAIPEGAVEEAVAWFEGEASQNLPEKVWDREFWNAKKSEAEKIVSWCGTVGAILEGLPAYALEAFRPLLKRLKSAEESFKPVAEHGESETDRRWKRDFDGVLLKLVYASFQPLKPEELAALNRIMRAVPEGMVATAVAWFEREATENVPEQVWHQDLWASKKSEAAKIVAWCQAVRAVLEGIPAPAGPKFQAVDQKAAKAESAFRPVAEFAESDGDRRWLKEFDQVMLKLVYGSFQPLNPEELNALRKILHAVPEGLAATAASWFEREASQNIPEKVWHQDLWDSKRTEAEKIVAWCRAVRSLLEGMPSPAAGKFTAVAARVKAHEEAFEPVSKFTGSDVERKWKVKFETVQLALVFSSFEGISEDQLKPMIATMAGMPEGMAGEVSEWFGRECDSIPVQVWKKPLWLTNRQEARRIVDWARAAVRVLGGAPSAVQGRFQEVTAKIQSVIQRYTPVMNYRGKITLKIFVQPDADVRSIQVGEQWIVRDGKKVETDAGRIAGDDLSSPLLVEDLDIGGLVVVLAIPGKADRRLTFSGDEMKNGETYLLGGSTEKSDGIKLRRLR